MSGHGVPMQDEGIKDSVLEEVIRNGGMNISTMKKLIVSGLAIFVSLLVLYSSAYGPCNYLFYRSLILSVILVLTFMQYPMFKKAGERVSNIAGKIDIVFIFLVVMIQVYVIVDFDAFVLRQGSPDPTDVILGSIYILLVIEATRRTIGWVMVILSVFFLGELLISDKLFWIFYGPPMSLSQVVDFVWMRDEGLYSTPIMSVFTYVIPFLIFAAFLIRSGAAKFFLELAVSLTGRTIGGPAKAAIVSSGLMGSISGSAVANVVGTGSFTIPMMKRIGYRPEFAGAVEAVASTGGQIMPPVMGAAAFILAQNLQLPYGKVIIYAFIPALLYYVALFLSVHLEAKRIGLKGLPSAEIPKAFPILKNRGFLLIPLFIIIVMVFMGFSCIKAALYATVALIPLTMIRKETRLTPLKFISALEDAVRDLVPIAVACAAAGLIIAGVTISGVGLQFAYLITVISHGILWITLILVMVAAVVLGFGLPTTAVYVTVAVLLSPALEQMGLSALQAHLFCFYYGVVAAITPPVALASFAAAGVAKTDPMDTGYVAFRLGLAGFIIPFMFAYGEELLMQGTPLNIIIAVVTGLVGLYALSSSIIGFFWKEKVGPFTRVILLVTAVTMIYPGFLSDIVGVGIMTAIIFFTKNGVGQVAYERE